MSIQSNTNNSSSLDIVGRINAFLGYDVLAVTIIAGGDYDGSTTAGIVQSVLEAAGVEVTVRYERSLNPGLVLSNNVNILVDLPIDNRADQAAVELYLRKNWSRIGLVIDHHQGDEQYVIGLGEAKCIVGKAPSCPQLLADNGLYVSKEILGAANFMDDPTGGHVENDVAVKARKAFTAALADVQEKQDSTRLNQVLHGFTLAAITSMIIDMNAELGEKIAENTAEVIARAEVIGQNELGNKVALVKMTTDDVTPLTPVILPLYKVADIVIVQFFSRENGAEVTTVAHNLKQAIDLLTSFGLTSGTSSRASLANSHEADLTKVIEALGIKPVETEA